MSHFEKERKYPHKPLVYICSPYRGDIETNTQRAREFSRFALDEGNIPLAPHLLFPQFIDDDDPEERELALLMNMVLLEKCREVWVLGSDITKGMACEIQQAKIKKRPVRYFDQDFKEDVENDAENR